MIRKKLSRLYVHEDVKKRLKAEAASAGMSLQDYCNFKFGTDSNEKKKRFKGVF